LRAAVHGGEKMNRAIGGGWKRPHQVHVNVAEPGGGDRYWLCRAGMLPRYFRPGTMLALAAPHSDVGGQGGPHKSAGDELACCTYPRVR
jgi:hypothetical protein